MGLEDQRHPIMSVDGGIIWNQPKSILDDNQWINCNNIRFKTGALQKVEGWYPFKGIKLPQYAIKIENYYKTDDSSWLMFHTHRGIYYYDDATSTIVDITKEPLHMLPKDTIACEDCQDWYVIATLNDPIYYWDGIQPKVRELPGTISPAQWGASRAVAVNTYVRPTNAKNNGFIYICTVAGTTAGAEPVWPVTVGSGVNDGSVRWELVGTYGLEGTTATQFTTKSLLNFNGFLLAGHTIEDGENCPLRVRWSQFGNPTRWINNADGSGQSGFFDVDDDVSWVQALQPLGSYVVIYKERAIQVMGYIGAPLVWEKRNSIVGVGLTAPDSLVDLGDEHIFLGPDNFYSFDLVETKEAGDAVAKTFYDIAVPDYVTRVKSFFVEEIPEAWFCFHSTENERAVNGDPDAPFDKAMVYNTETKAWSVRDMPMTAFGYYSREENQTIDGNSDIIDTASYVFDTSVTLQNSPLNMMCDEFGYLYILGGYSFSHYDSSVGRFVTDDIDAYAETKYFDFGYPEVLKRIKRVQVMTTREGNYNLEVYIGTAYSADDVVDWYGPFNMNLSRLRPPWTDMDISGRYICIKFRTPHQDEPFLITGFQVTYQMRGLI